MARLARRLAKRFIRGCGAGVSIPGMVASAGQAHVAPGVVLGDGALVHESAYVDAGAVIGAGTRIWHFSHVMGGAHIGARCSLECHYICKCLLISLIIPEG